MIKSPLNYTGGKFKLLPQLLPLFPAKVGTFVDLFCGGANVGVNVNADKVICYDRIPQLIDLYCNLSERTSEQVISVIDGIVNKYDLSKENREGYLQLRDYYNENKDWGSFLALIFHAFNHQIRFNRSGEYNMPFGKGKSSFNPRLRSNLKAFVDRLQEIDITFHCRDFREAELDELTEDDFVYADPPYLLTCAAYNEQGGWTEKDERDLYNLLDGLNERNVKFALSNVMEHGGKTNEILLNWSSNYIVHDLSVSYGNSNYHKKDRGKSREVLITNYCGRTVSRVTGLRRRTRIAPVKSRSRRTGSIRSRS